MKLNEQSTATFTLLEIEGRIDSTTSAVLEKKLLAMIEDKGLNALIMEFSKVDYISSAGLRVLISAAKYLIKNNGRLALVGLNANVREVFDIAGFFQMFEIYDTREEAIRSF